MGAILRLSLHQLAGRWRLTLILLLALLPVVITAIITAVGDFDKQSDFAEFLLDAMIVAAVLPIVSMALATAAFGNELEDRTLSYLALRPISRWRIVLAKLLAVLLVGAPLLIVSGVVATLIGLEGKAQPAAAVAVALLVGVVTYSAIFTWAGLVTTRALGFALVYVFVWEGLLSTFLGGIRYLSVRAYTVTIIHGLDEERFDVLGELAIQLPAAIGGAIAVTAVFVWLTVRRLRNMDVP